MDARLIWKDKKNVTSVKKANTSCTYVPKTALIWQMKKAGYILTDISCYMPLKRFHTIWFLSQSIICFMHVSENNTFRYKTLENLHTWSMQMTSLEGPDMFVYFYKFLYPCSEWNHFTVSWDRHFAEWFKKFKSFIMQ